MSESHDVWRFPLAGCLATVLLATALASGTAGAASAAGSGDPWLSKRQARTVAVTTAADTCRAVGWCTSSRVVPARRCRRYERRTVYCGIAFLTAANDRCEGVVGVSRKRNGRIDRNMAVPSNCSGGGGMVTSRAG